MSKAKTQFKMKKNVYFDHFTWFSKGRQGLDFAQYKSPWSHNTTLDHTRQYLQFY